MLSQPPKFVIEGISRIELFFAEYVDGSRKNMGLFLAGAYWARCFSLSSLIRGPLISMLLRGCIKKNTLPAFLFGEKLGKITVGTKVFKADVVKSRMSRLSSAHSRVPTTPNIPGESYG
jgi:hypothetical protein